MKAVIQRVQQAAVEISGRIAGEIGQGLVVLLGIGETDDAEDVAYLSQKIPQLRIFSDSQDKMNLSLLDIHGEMLVISQFTLFANTRKGRRPSFMSAASPEKAEPLYQKFIAGVKSQGVNVSCGEFGADMLVKIFNDGPVTILMESADRFKSRRSAENQL